MNVKPKQKEQNTKLTGIDNKEAKPSQRMIYGILSSPSWHLLKPGTPEHPGSNPKPSIWLSLKLVWKEMRHGCCWHPCNDMKEMKLLFMMNHGNKIAKKCTTVTNVANYLNA